MGPAIIQPLSGQPFEVLHGGGIHAIKDGHCQSLFANGIEFIAPSCYSTAKFDGIVGIRICRISKKSSAC